MNDNEMVEQVANEFFKRIQMSRERDNKYKHLWSKNELKIRQVVECNAEDYYTRFLAAHNREVVAYHREVAAHKREIAAKDAEIARLRALVGEMADNASLLKDEVCVGCRQKLSACEEQKCSLVKNTDALVAKALEVVK